MKIAVLSKYGAEAATTRQRFLQYQPVLQAAGIELELHPLLDDDYLRRLYAGRRTMSVSLFVRYLKRLRWLLTAKNIDAVWLQYELFPYLPGIFERLLGRVGKPVIFDFDDATFHTYDLHRSSAIRFVLKNKIRCALSGSTLAFCGNQYLEDYATPYTETVVVPTVVDTTLLQPLAEPNISSATLRVGWIGTPSTWEQYMVPMEPVFAELLKNHRLELHVMGACGASSTLPNTHFHAWSEDAELPFLQSLDIGVMPLTDTPWARGKCGFKLIQYMACGVPVIASPVGVNDNIVEHDQNGFLARDHNDWMSAFGALIANAALRKRLGAASRLKAERDYSLGTWGPRVLSRLQRAINGIDV